MATAAQDADAAPAGYVVLTTVDQRFLRMFDLWFRYYAETGIEWPVHVAAIGQTACAAIRARARRWPLIVHPVESGDGGVTVRRLGVLKMLLDRGVDVVSTDLDAFWLSKRTPELADRRFDRADVNCRVWVASGSGCDMGIFTMLRILDYSLQRSNQAADARVDRKVRTE